MYLAGVPIGEGYAIRLQGAALDQQFSLSVQLGEAVRKAAILAYIYSVEVSLETSESSVTDIRTGD